MRHIIMNLFLFSAVVGGFSCCCDGPTKPDTDSSLGCSILPGGTGSFWVYIDSTWRDGALQPVKDVRLTVTGASIQDGRVVYTTDATAFLPSTFTSECDTTFSVTMARGGQSFLTPIFLKGRTQPDTFMTLLGDVGVLFWAQELREALRTPSGVYEHCTIVAMVDYGANSRDETYLYPGLGIVRRLYIGDTRDELKIKTVLTLKTASRLLNG